MVIREHQGNRDVPGRAGVALPGPVVSDRLDGLYGGLGDRMRVVVSQLPLTITVGLVVAAAAIFSPEAFDDTLFQAALLAHLAIFVICLAVPWDRLPEYAFAVVAVLDCLAVGFTREAGGASFNVLSLLMVFPVIWLAAHRPLYMTALAVLSAILGTVVPPIALGSPPAGGSMIRTIILPLVMSAIAVTSHQFDPLPLQRR